MSSTKIQLSIVLPCYNEADNLVLLLSQYLEAWEDVPAELILVDNGSTDTTPQILAEELQKPQHAFARSVRVPTNLGYGHGIATGLGESHGEFVAFSHADMQCSPKDIFSAYRRLLEQPKPKNVLVKGKRGSRSLGASVVTNGMSVLASIILSTWITDINAQPKVFHSSHLRHLENSPSGFEFDTYVLYKSRQAGLQILTVPVIFGERIHGQSKWAYSFHSKARTIWKTITYLIRLRLRKEIQ